MATRYLAARFQTVRVQAPNLKGMNLEDLSLNEAAKLCQVSPSTIRRNRERLRGLGAVTEPSGWHVTLEQLIAAGLTTKVRPQAPEEVPATPSKDAQVEALEAHIATLEAALARERVRADMAERRFDRLIEAGSGPASGQVSASEQLLPPAPQRQVEEGLGAVTGGSVATGPVEARGFWSRLFNR